MQAYAHGRGLKRSLRRLAVNLTQAPPLARRGQEGQRRDSVKDEGFPSSRKVSMCGIIMMLWGYNLLRVRGSYILGASYL